MPMWINFVIRTGATRELLTWMGIGGGTHPELATIIGLVYNYLPFVILPIYSTMLKMDKSQIEASYDLGANGFQTFSKVIIPMTMPGIISGVTMVLCQQSLLMLFLIYYLNTMLFYSVHILIYISIKMIGISVHLWL